MDQGFRARGQVNRNVFLNSASGLIGLALISWRAKDRHRRLASHPRKVHNGVGSS